MSYALQSRRFAQRAVNVTVQCLHGSLLTAGVVVTILLATIVSDGWYKHGSFGYHFRQFALATGLGTPTAAEIEAQSMAEDDDVYANEARVPVISQRTRAMADYVARRYRVANEAVLPLIQVAEESSAANGLDPLLVVAVIGVESGFNPFSQSVVGAQGLMQVVGRVHSDKLGPDAEPGALLDPETNIQVGVRVLRESIQRTGSLSRGLQQYAGALDDPDRNYSSKVLAERQRLLQAVRRARMEGV
ncbi:MAG: transglycosylase SLT domain-containing protein [Zoogloea sp.]|uniref:transglycosylase SLT domain-containing protein n=1 Tax=Zoogloea sp. TaxID=49181 RepID=UPI003F3E3789